MFLPSACERVAPPTAFNLYLAFCKGTLSARPLVSQVILVTGHGETLFKGVVSLSYYQACLVTTSVQL